MNRTNSDDKIKTIRISASVETAEYETQKCVTLTVEAGSAKELALAFTLLREKLVSSLEILFDNCSLYLKLNKDPKVSVCTSYSKSHIKAAISINALGYGLFYLLKYYRDGIGEAEHIDIDFGFNQHTEVTLTIKTEVYKEISAEEMNKLLDS
jgi:hypothetical protein